MKVSAHKKIAGLINLLSALAKIVLSGMVYIFSYFWKDSFSESDLIDFFTDIGFFTSFVTFFLGIIILVGSIGAFAGKNWAVYMLTLLNALLAIGVTCLMYLGFPFPIIYPFTYLFITIYMVVIVYKNKTQYKLSSAR